MPQVPYSPVNQEVLDATPLPERSPRIEVAAFGGDVAAAIQTVGKTVEHAGDQIFERAMWLQSQTNQAEARKAEADYIIRAGNLQANFNSLEGYQAKAAYPEFANKMKALRDSIKGSLTTQESQRRFDEQSLGTMSRGMFNAASHMVTQQKKFINDSYDAKRTSLVEQAAANPDDEVGRERAIRQTKAINEEQGRLQGKPREAIDNANRASESKITRDWIERQAQEYPMTGPELLENQRHKLTEADAKYLKNVVENQRDAYGTSKIPQDYLKSHLDDEGNLTVSVDEAQADMRKMAEKFSPDDPKFAQKLVRGFQSELYIAQQAKKAQQRADLDTVNSGILGGATKMDDILSVPETRDAYYRLPKKDQLALPGRIDSYVKSRDRQFNERAMTNLIGLKNNDVEAFLNVNPEDPKYALSEPQIRSIMNEQAKIKKQGAGQDPRVSKAMGWMRASFGSQMQAMGIYNRTQKNTEDYDHLTGAVQNALDIWMEQHKKPPTQGEFNEKIAKPVLQTQTESWSQFFNRDRGFFELTPSSRTLFQHDTSSKEYRRFYDATKSAVEAQEGRTPHDEEIYKAFTRVQLLKLFPAKGKGATDGGTP